MVGALKPALLLVPARGRGEALVSLDARVPEVGGQAAARAHDPVGMAEVSGAVGGELGAAAADQAVELGGEPHQRARRRNADVAAADGLAQRLGEVLVAPAARSAVVGLDD